jgi:hypothetical protein
MDNTLMFNLGKYLSEDGDMVGDLARGLRVFPGLREARALGAAKWVRGETSFCLGNVVMSETVFVAVMKRLGADLLVCPRGRMVRLGVGDDHFYSRVDMAGVFRNIPFVNVGMAGRVPEAIPAEVRRGWRPEPVDMDVGKFVVCFI